MRCCVDSEDEDELGFASENVSPLKQKESKTYHAPKKTASKEQEAKVENVRSLLKKDGDDEPMPLIKSGVSIAADMRFGWRPQ